jgi:hypothetical protein
LSQCELECVCVCICLGMCFASASLSVCVCICLSVCVSAWVCVLCLSATLLGCVFSGRAMQALLRALCRRTLCLGCRKWNRWHATGQGGRATRTRSLVVWVLAAPWRTTSQVRQMLAAWIRRQMLAAWIRRLIMLLASGPEVVDASLQQHARAELISASVAATCSSGVTLRFSGSNMVERSLSPLQLQQHARAELLSAADVVNINESDCQQPFRSVE